MRVLIYMYNIFINIIYFFFKILPVQNKIVMMSRQSNSINTDFRLIGAELEKKHKVIYLCKKIEGGIWKKFLYGLYTFKQLYHLATSQVCILDSYSPLVSMLKHKKCLKVIQIWHSIGTMKKFGYQILEKEEGRDAKIAKAMKMHKNYDIIFAASEAYSGHLAEGFGCSKDKIKIFTLPRADLLSDKQYEKNIKKKIYEKYPKLQEKKNIVYCPTFRKKDPEFDKAFKELADNINYEKYNFIFKPHFLSETICDNINTIIDKEFSTFDMLFVADYVISDYSCVIYEAGIRNIPLYFYCYDMDKYEESRGLNIDYEELPGYKESDAKKLIQDIEKDYDMEYLKNFIHKYITNTQNCTKKIVDEIEKNIKK